MDGWRGVTKLPVANDRRWPSPAYASVCCRIGRCEWQVQGDAIGIRKAGRRPKAAGVPYKIRTFNCKQGEKFGYWITLSARANMAGGIVRPSAFAALRLMTNSNFVGCSIGRSAGFAPLRILST